MDRRDDLGAIDLGIIDLGEDDDLELPAQGVAYRRPHDARAHLGGLDLDAFEGLEEVTFDHVGDAEELTMHLPRRARSRGRASRQSAKTVSLVGLTPRGATDNPRPSARDMCAAAARGESSGGGGESAALNLQRQDLSDEDAASFVAPMLRSPDCRLATLILTRNRLTDAGAASLAEALLDAKGCGRGTLSRLDLNQNDIGDTGAAVLLAAIAGSRVTRLDLAWNGDIATGIEVTLRSPLPTMLVKLTHF